MFILIVFLKLFFMHFVIFLNILIKQPDIKF